MKDWGLTAYNDFMNRYSLSLTDEYIVSKRFSLPCPVIQIRLLLVGDQGKRKILYDLRNGLLRVHCRDVLKRSVVVRRKNMLLLSTQLQLRTEMECFPDRFQLN
jgi:hypothetical protein